MAAHGEPVTSLRTAPASGRHRASALWLVDGEHGLWRYAAASALVLAGCALAQWVLVTCDLTRISPILLMSVLFTATWRGARPSLFAAVFSFAAYRVMLMQPELQARVSATDQIITLTLFMMAALLTGSLAGRMRDAGKRSAALATRNKALFLASRAISEAEDELDIRAVLRANVSALTGAPASWTAAGTASHVSQLRADGDEIEALHWSTPAHLNAEDENDLASTVQLMTDLAGAAIARARAANDRAKLETIAQTERLQAALLSSVSHDFRTPLTAILTSASSLRTFEDQFDAATRHDLCVTIEEETNRLNQFVEKLLHVTRLEAGALKAAIVPFDVRNSVDAVVGRICRDEEVGRIQISGQAGVDVLGDQLLFEHALTNVVENALRFSSGKPVLIEVQRAGRDVTLKVTDSGRGVPNAELDVIFDRFYRASNNESAGQGCGLGLSIARGLLTAMAGSISAHPGRGGIGLEVRLALPAAP